jgi:catechol 2,3-dioxygenase
VHESGSLSEGEGALDPEQLEAAGLTAPPEIAAATTLGPVHLTVADLARSVEYYETAIGLAVIERDGDSVTLGSGGRALLVLVEEPGAGSSAGYTGLYHFALLVPERTDLARWLVHAARDRVAMTGMSDHFVSEALYLRDPDGHGIEIYWDRPREHWEGIVAERMTSIPLDTGSIIRELDDPESATFEGLAAGTVMGHVHLKVADIPETIAFYRDRLGMALMADMGASAAFLSAGGYHHHVGANVWESLGAGPPPAGSAALRHATVVLPDQAELDRVVARLERSGSAVEETPDGALVRDPAGNGLVLTAA